MSRESFRAFTPKDSRGIVGDGKYGNVSDTVYQGSSQAPLRHLRMANDTGKLADISAGTLNNSAVVPSPTHKAYKMGPLDATRYTFPMGFNQMEVHEDRGLIQAARFGYNDHWTRFHGKPAGDTKNGRDGSGRRITRFYCPAGEVIQNFYVKWKPDQLSARARDFAARDI